MFKGILSIVIIMLFQSVLAWTNVYYVGFCITAFEFYNDTGEPVTEFKVCIDPPNITNAFMEDSIGWTIAFNETCATFSTDSPYGLGCDCEVTFLLETDGFSFYRYEVFSNDSVVEADSGVIIHNAVNEETNSPEKVEISAYPNPFNSALTIELNGATEYAEISITDISGKIIKNFTMPKSTYNYTAFRWDGTDQNGEKVPSGKYFITVKSKNGITSLPVDYIR